MPYFANTVYSDAQASKYVDGAGVHWYFGDAFPQLEQTHDQFPDKFILATEGCETDGVKLQDWGRGEDYGHDILGDLNHWVIGWTDWNIVLNQQGGPNHLTSNNFCKSNG